MSRTRTFWIASEIYYPDLTSTGHLLTRLAEGLARDHRVAVLCAQPSYDRTGHEAPSRERKADVEIVRVAHPRFDRRRIHGRIVNIVFVTLRMWWAGLRAFRRGDIVMAATNPPLLPYALSLAAKLRGARLALLIHDVYPDAAINAGVLKRRSLSARLWLAASKRLYRAADRIVVVGRDMAEVIGARTGDGTSRIVVIPNWADLDEIAPHAPTENALLRSLGLTSRFVVGVVGNMGHLQNVEMMLESAKLVAERDPDVHFLFVGDGSKQSLIEEAAARPGSNVTTLGARPRAEQSDFLGACNVAAITLIPGMYGIGVPSRLYNALASGRAIITALDKAAEPARVVLEEDVGVQVPSGDPTAFAEAVLALRHRSDYLLAARTRARAVAEKRFSYSLALEQYRALLDGLR